MTERPLRTVCVCLCLTLLLPITASALLSNFDPAAGDQSAAKSDGRQSEQPTIQAYRLNGDRIRLDGRLDDDAWRSASSGRGFIQMEPNRGEQPSEQTVFKVAYDEDAIYFGVACYERDPSRVASSLTRRDRLTASDMVSVYIDPYHDRNTGYNFRVNPDGVEEDSYIYDDGNGRDSDWDAVWESETTRDENGWYAEMRIPFSSIRYRPGESMTWGLQVYRWMHGRGEDNGWAHWDRDAAGFVSRFGAVTGIAGVGAPRQLEVMPYTVTRATDPSVLGAGDELQNFQNFGADLKYGITPNLTLNATFQPDFGQVEADPSQLNLSPYETFYSEKRPFFIEGSRFFQHPHFNLFYSRRIGTGSENSRIRFASKLLGKTAGDVSVAAMIAATDETVPGQAHNPFKAGKEQTWYGIGRFGKEFSEGRHRVNLMGTAVLRGEERTLADDRPWAQRDAYSGGMDFDLNFQGRKYNVNGSVVGTMIDPEPIVDDPAADHSATSGTGGTLAFNKRGGSWRYGGQAGWESDKLNPNDMGFLSAPDEVTSRAYLRYQYNSDGEGALINSGNQELSIQRQWLYASRTEYDPASPGDVLWSYDAGRPKLFQVMYNGWGQLRNFWSAWYGVWYTPDGINPNASRGGPLVVEPEGVGGWFGFNTDDRKPYMLEFSFNTIVEGVGTEWYQYNVYTRWVQSSRMNHSLSFGYDTKRDIDQWVGNFGDDDASQGIGGTHYVFAELDRQVYDMTLRSSLLFSKDQSLEVYLQPFLAVGSYSQPVELMTPEVLDYRPFAAAGFDVSEQDFSFAAVNLNLVYRWEYRPGSTFYLVWAHSRSQYDARGLHSGPGGFDNSFSLDPLFDNEPENTFLAKFTYWFAI